jgi:peptidoglycan/LPS O-acetylase OafA/YrhL
VSVPDAITEIADVFMGVPIFFILSGFLIWGSIGRSGSFKDYAVKRAIRIFPELWVGVLIEILLLIILLKEKINWILLAAFTFGQATVFQFWTPDFLRGYGCGTPNGTLWTLGVTIQFYFVVWFIYKLLKNKKIYWWISALVLSIVIKALSPTISDLLPGVIGKLYSQTLFPYLWMFLFGAFLANYKEKAVPILKKIWWILLPLSFAFSISRFDIGFEGYGVFTYLLRVSGFIGLCYNLPKLNIKFDISYGLFIYHMIVVNLMIEFGWTGKIYYLIIALLVSIILASASTWLGRVIPNILDKNKQRR